jgi:hypothetical protein
MYVDEHQSDWDIYLPYTAFAYNTSIHSATGKSPFTLIYGREVQLPTDIIDYVYQPEMINEYHQNIVDRFKKIYNEVRANDLRLKIK